MWKQHIEVGMKNVDCAAKTYIMSTYSLRSARWHRRVQTMMWQQEDSGTTSTQRQWGCTAYLRCCVSPASLSVIEANGGNCLKWAKISVQLPNLWFPFSSCSSSGLWRLFHMQTPHHGPPPTPAPNPTFLFPNPLIPSPPHLRQQYPSRRTTPLSTGFCGIYSNILTFRLPSLPEQKWFVTAGDGLGQRSFLQHPAHPPTPHPPPL